MEERAELGQDIIPGLCEDVAIQCLARISRIHYCNVTQVSKGWRNMFMDSQSKLHRFRTSQCLHEISVMALDLTSPFKVTTRELFLQSGIVIKRAYSTPFRWLPDNDRKNDRLYTTLWNGAYVAIMDEYKPKGSGSFFVIDVFRERIREAKNMNFPRLLPVCAVMGDFLYVAGGVTCCPTCNTRGSQMDTVDPQNISRIVERYHFETDSWTRVADLPICILNSGSERGFSVAGKLVFVGSHVNKPLSAHLPNTCQCLCYSPCSDKWQILGTDCIFQLHIPHLVGQPVYLPPIEGPRNPENRFVRAYFNDFDNRIYLEGTQVKVSRQNTTTSSSSSSSNDLKEEDNEEEGVLAVQQPWKSFSVAVVDVHPWPKWHSGTVVDALRRRKWRTCPWPEFFAADNNGGILLLISVEGENAWELKLWQEEPLILGENCRLYCADCCFPNMDRAKPVAKSLVISL